MRFIHDDNQEFADLIEIVADARGLRRSIVEKDYWVTHALWALSAAGFDVWFKGGTSLSKGFGLIERFSEDLDLKVEPGRGRGTALSGGPRVMDRTVTNTAASARQRLLNRARAEGVAFQDLATLYAM